MKLKYETGIATLIQLILMSALTFASQTGSVVKECTKDGGNCARNLLTSVILYLLVTFIFGFIWLIGVTAQARRSRRLAQLLISIECFTALIALFSIKLALGHGNKSLLGLLASLAIAGLAAWIMLLAWRLMRAGGGRIVTGQRARQRRRSGT